MYSCNVGTKFKIGFFKQFLNFCYDREKGVLYADDLRTLEDLNISKNLIAETHLKEHETLEITKLEQSLKLILEQCEDNFNKMKELEERTQILEKEKVTLERTIKNLIEYLKDVLSQQEKFEQEQEEVASILKNSIGILNKKIKSSNESVENLGIRFEAILEIVSEQIASSKQVVNVMGPHMSIEKIWNSMENKETAAVLSIMYMMKKFLEDKGTRF